MHFSKAQRLILSSSLSVFLAGCGAPNYAPSEMHMTVEEVRSEAPKDPAAIPALVKATPTVPVMSNEKGADTFDVVVTNVPVRDLLFALARDAGVNMDVDSEVGGLITMSALDQTLEAILERISQQVAIRTERVGNAIIVKNDEPYHKRYHVDYTSVTRSFSSSADSSGLGDGGASITSDSENSFWENLEESIAVILDVEFEGEGDPGAIAGVENEATVEADESEARYTTDNSFDFNTDTGILLVYAPDRLQKEVQAYLDEALSIARRQVLLEATVVEVVLNNEYRQGIDWTAFNSLARDGLALYQGASVGGPAALINEVLQEFDFESTQTFVDTNGDGAITPSDEQGTDGQGRDNTRYAGQYQRYLDFGNVDLLEKPGRVITEFSFDTTVNEAEGTDLATVEVTREFSVTEQNEEATQLRAGGLVPATSLVPGAAFTAAYRSQDVTAAVQLLDQFGDAKVLSSPRISVLNNQSALLRVVDQEVYFSIEVSEEVNEDTGQVSSRSFEITENTVDVGFSMNVLPHITDSDEVYLNLKPAVTRVLSYRRAPTPAVVGTNSGTSENFVPITRIRELESVMALRDGEIAVMGGLLEDRTGDNNTSVPGLASLPGVGTLFENKQETTFKTEFVVFIKARIITNPSLHGDYSDYQDLLPDSEFIIRDRVNTGLPVKQKKAR